MRNPTVLHWRTVHANSCALARYAALRQAARIVPIVEPEILMNGSHGIAVCRVAATDVLAAVFGELDAMGADHRGIVLKPNMIVSASERACANLAAINAHAATAGTAPWRLTFSFGCALVDGALRTWRGVAGNIDDAQNELAGSCRRASEAWSKGFGLRAAGGLNTHACGAARTVQDHRPAPHLTSRIHHGDVPAALPITRERQASRA